MSNAKAVVKELNEGQRFGDLAWWTLENISVTRQDLESEFTKFGLDHKYMPPEVCAHATFRQAISKYSHNRRKKGKVSTMLIRPVLENTEEIIYAVVDESVDEAQETLAHNVPHRIVFKKSSSSVHLRGGATTIGKLVKEWYEVHRDRYNTTDLRRMLVKSIDQMGGICLKPKGGGVYFVPSNKGDDLRKLQSVVRIWEIGRSGDVADLGILEQARTKRNQTQLAHDTKKSLDVEVQDLINEVKAWSDEKAPRRDTMRRRLEEYSGLRDRLRFFRSLLGVTITDLESSLQDMDAQVNSMLLGAEEVVSSVTKKREERKARRQSRRGDRARLVRKASR